MMDPEVIEAARLLWDYSAAFGRVEPCDAVVVCCSYDLRVADFAAGLLAAGVAPLAVLSGSRGNWTSRMWRRPEAEVFAERMLAAGAPPERLLLEPRAENIGQNVALSLALLPDGARPLFVTKPNTLLRVALTAPAVAPGRDFRVAAPPLAFPEDVSPAVGLLGVVDELVGDVDRVLAYPRLGFQVPHALPAEVLAAQRLLIERGFTGHRLRGAP